MCCGHRPLRRPIAGASSPETTPLGGDLSRAFGGDESAAQSAENIRGTTPPVVPAKWRGGRRVRSWLGGLLMLLDVGDVAPEPFKEEPFVF